VAPAELNLAREMAEMARQAAQAGPRIAALDRRAKDALLLSLAEKIKAEAAFLQAENRLDVAEAQAQGRPAAFIDRLTLSPKVIEGMIQGLRDVAALPDPVGEIESMWLRPSGLRVGKLRVPLGLIGFIFESRPNVIVEAAGLCLKAGNALILKGGSEALRSNLALGQLIKAALSQAGLPPAAVQVVESTDHAAVTELLKLNQYIDLLIPRGGEGLIRLVAEQARMPVLKHYKGVCHLFVDLSADLDMALSLALNGKVQRPGTCNALETLLVHRSVAAEFLPRAGAELIRAGVELRGCPETRRLVPQAREAGEADWSTEYLDLILSVKVVAGLDEALDHIARYGTRHTEVICTSDYGRAQLFLNRVDASVVMVNASPRLNDGGQLGLGAEIGISTDKLHAYGPMGLKELTTTKFIVCGQGQVRE